MNIFTLTKILRLHLIDELKKRGFNDYVYPDNHDDIDLPYRFFLVRVLGLRDKGQRALNPTIEVCAYARNLQQGNSQTKPNQEELEAMTGALLDILQDKIIKNVSITEIEQTKVSDPDIRYFYNSLVCKTLTVK